MERKMSPSLLEQHGFNIKSSFISQYSPEHRDKTTHLTSRKQLSSSTFLDLEESKAKFAAHRKPTRKETQYLPHAEQLTRARSLKNIEDPKFKTLQVIEGEQLGSLGQSTLRLKAEEQLFKIKVWLATLLKEVGRGEDEVVRLKQLDRMEEVIHFMCEKVRLALTEASNLASNSNASTSKQREALKKAEIELQQLRGKLQERENSERAYKTKLKESHSELKELYDRVNVKEKEYSQRTTEIYQLRVQMKEYEKTADLFKGKLQTLQKERNELKSLLQTAKKEHTAALAALQQEKQQLATEVTQAKEQAERGRERCGKVEELNAHLKEELTRWRERVQFEGERESERERSSEEGPHTPNDLMGVSLQELKKSTMSMNSAYINNFNSSVRVHSLTALEIDNTRLKLQLAELQKEKENLQRTLLNYAPNKVKYQETLEGTEVGSDLSIGLDGRKLDYLRERSSDLYRLEVQAHYKRRTEQIAREWKDKLFDIVCKYEDDNELLRNEIASLKQERQQAQKRIYALANDKYIIETRLIEVEKELYTLNHRSTKSLLSYAHPEDLHSLEKESEERSSEEVITSNPHLLPIQEEESPTKPRPDASSSVSAFTPREENVSREDSP